MTLRFAIGLIALIAFSLAAKRAVAEEFTVQPGDFPESSSVGVKLSALISRDSDDSALSGRATIDLIWEDGEISQATIVDMELELDDKIDLSLLFGTFSGTIEPGAAKVRMLEPGFSTPVTSNQFSQIENEFILEGEILLNDEVYNIEDFGPIFADLNDIEILTTPDIISTNANLDLSFDASEAAGGIPVQIDVQGSVLATYLQGDFNENRILDAGDIDLIATAISDENDDSIYDLTRNGIVDEADRVYLVQDRLQTSFGDANLDGQFNSVDFVVVFQRGQYEDEVPLNSGWADGDWNGDAEFNSSDLVVAFQGGGWSNQANTGALVPEPSCVTLLLPVSLLIWTRIRRQ